MPRKRFSVEQIINMTREADVLLAQGQTVQFLGSRSPLLFKYVHLLLFRPLLSDFKGILFAECGDGNSDRKQDDCIDGDRDNYERVTKRMNIGASNHRCNGGCSAGRMHAAQVMH